MAKLDSLDLSLPDWAISVFIVLVTVGILLSIKHLILSRLIRLSDKTRYYFDSLLLRAIKWPLSLIALLFGILLLEELLNANSAMSSRLEKMTTYILPTLLVLAIVMFVDSMITGMISHYSKKSRLLHNSQSIMKGVSRSFLYGIGILILLSTLGVSITPLIASLGIGSLAVALALQPTLENFFSGVQLLMDRPIRVGDFIELDSGEQGFVEKIGWRSTWIKMLPNNTIIMPNSLLSESKVINYFYPQRELSVPVEVNVHYDSDLEKVEEITLEVAREILKSHEYGVNNYNTFVVFHTFDSSSINFTVMLRAHEYFHQFFIRSAFIKALHKRFKVEGIVIPYPIRAINTDQENVHFKEKHTGHQLKR
ncbi:Small-conductance mechanosensitive channel [Marinomonas spartinae]|uniref:mechanosensitive ion channel family protein n=1 Tax=Marinomonas spartinae TaxID=1792290 RepID=UPI000808E291|nr:mechanosensitive ion channel family protein [Marinomonas spartinae]SBS39104.1 Small-conductance mechanosensitive channel [Marinomonas spartinae]